ncbi:chaplin [Streptomyces lydicus]|uniref:chaplin n=1 Tax=Streptomyces lydicus TaxID=47763 RepID=UPI00379C4F13
MGRLRRHPRAAPPGQASNAAGGIAKSPGALSGNALRVPAHTPVGVCGNTVDIIGLLNPAFGNNGLNSLSNNRNLRFASPRGPHTRTQRSTRIRRTGL